MADGPSGRRPATDSSARLRRVPGDRVNRHGGWPVPDLTTRTEPPGAVVDPARDDRSRPGPRRGAAPARGAGQADRRGEVRRRPRLPGRLVRGHDPLDRRARALRRARPRPGLRLVEGRGRHRGRHPRRQRRELDQGRPADPRPDRRRDPAPCRAAGAPRRARPRDPARRAPRRSRRGPSRSPRSSTPRRPTTCSPPTSWPPATPTRPSPPPTSSSRASTGSATRSSSTSRTTR